MSLVKKYVEELLANRELKKELAHYENIPSKEPQWSEVPEGVSPALRQALASKGADRLYLHQAESIKHSLAGEDVVVATPTASGKTVCYNLPVIQECAENPDAHALYLFPIKALEQDQKSAFQEFAAAAGLAKEVGVEIYDGDTPTHKRSKIRNQPPSVVITNPDMLHVGMLAYHQKWEKLFENLCYVVLDEVHTYRGVFGSHVANVLRRLLRVAALYGSEPRIIACSGTIANPGKLVSGLTGRDVKVVDKNGAPSAGRHFLFINPERLSSSTVASHLLRQAVQKDMATIVFTKARKTTELIYTWAVQSDPRIRRYLSAYRAGYLPEERREIENKLFSGELKGVVSTSALEMGIDIGVLDVCVLVGYPGAITTTWQRGGRVGRKDESLIALVAHQDALDQYFMKHPQVFFRSGFEPAVIDPENRPIIKAHLACAAAEMPLEENDPWFQGARVEEAVAELQKEGMLLTAVDEKAWHARVRFPQREVNIRGIGESNTIFQEPEPGKPPEKKPRVIGSLDGNRVYTEGHPGAIYLHRARQYQVTRLDLKRRNLYARPVEVNYYTMPRREKDTDILGIKKSKPVQNFVVRQGELKVTERVIGYEKRRVSSGERISVHELDLPPFSFQTVGMWIEIDDFIQRAVNARGLNFMGGIHALEHAAIALFPLFALCERDDVGGISIPMHPQVEKAAVFIYDGYPGGVGLTDQAFPKTHDLVEATYNLIAECDCENGCPACIHSPKCGSGNVPLDKQAALMVLSMLLDKPEAREWIEAPVDAGEEPGVAELPGPGDPEPEEKAGPRILVLDIETRRGAAEVGGWHNVHLMGVALVAVWDSRDGETSVFMEDQVDELLDLMQDADLVVGFNLKGFDYKVLSAYDSGVLNSVPTFDILYDVHARLGYRLSLAHLAECNLGEAKSADGLQSLEWVKQGRMDLVADYCKKDVEITRDLLFHGLEKGWFRFKDKQGKLMEMALDWELEKLVEAARPSG
ncbi:MAG: DEAD/DEAH box helicase [bacterium]